MAMDTLIARDLMLFSFRLSCESPILYTLESTNGYTVPRWKTGIFSAKSLKPQKFCCRWVWEIGNGVKGVTSCIKWNFHWMMHLLSDVYKVDLHRQISNLMNSEAIGWFTPLELAAIGALFEGMQAHATNAIAEVVQGLVVFEKVLHDMVVSMQENHLGKVCKQNVLNSASLLLPKMM